MEVRYPIPSSSIPVVVEYDLAVPVNRNQWLFQVMRHDVGEVVQLLVPRLDLLGLRHRILVQACPVDRNRHQISDTCHETQVRLGKQVAGFASERDDPRSFPF